MHRIVTATTIVVAGIVTIKVVKEIKDFIVLDLALPQVYHQRKYHEQIVKATNKMKGMSVGELMAAARGEQLAPWLDGSNRESMQPGTYMT